MLSGRRIFWKNVDLIPKVITCKRQCNTSKQNELDVEIPRRIERESTDILKALASTIGRDPTGFHYKYPDDPYFYPVSAKEKRVYALSLESGRKSAKWIIKNNPGFFKNKLSEPPIQAFFEKPVYNESSQVTEETLVGEIEKRNVLDSITVYNLLLNNGIIISDEVKQSLLELVCFYNSEERPNNEELEAKWFANAEYEKLEVNSWTEGGFAECLFESMDKNCPLANSAIIQGMLKHNNIQKAFDLYKNAKSSNVPLSVGVYNGLLSQAANNSVDIPDGYAFIKEILEEMAGNQIEPNLGTLNSALKSLALLQRFGRNESFTKKLLMDFLHLGIEPSLGSYCYIFRIFINQKNFSQASHFIFDLLTIIKATKFDVKHPFDFHFFPNAMSYFCTFSKGIKLVNALNSILLQNGNMKFIDKSFTESNYFREYFMFILRHEPLDAVMEKYRSLVPTVYSPEINVYERLLKAAIVDWSVHNLVEIWEDIKKMKISRVFMLSSRALSAMQLQDEAALKVAYEGAINCEEELKGNWATQEIASQIMICYLKVGDFQRALKFYKEKICSASQHGLLSAQAVMELFRYAFGEKNVPLMLELIRYAENEIYSEIKEMAEMALPLLSETDKVYVAQFIKEEENEEASNDQKNEAEELNEKPLTE